jgi:oxygen-dependent protoporphyrinogen oxidase
MNAGRARQRVAIVGGGITGLSAAYDLSRGGAEVTLLEARSTLGGNLRTAREGAYTIEAGPDSWVASKPDATQLAKELGIELIGTREDTRKVYIVWEGKLFPIPEGLILGIPTKIEPIVRTPLFTWDAKVRMAMEPLVPPRIFHGDEDESIGDFMTRRLGEQVTERLAGPLLGGVYSGDANVISVRATLPQFVDAEQKYGSLVRAMRATRKAPADGKPAPSAFLTPVGGVAELAHALERRLAGVHLRMGVRATKIGVVPSDDMRGRYAVELEGAETVFADHVILAAPSYVTAALVRPLDGACADDLDRIVYSSSATVYFAFDEADVPRPLDAVGFIAPKESRRRIVASTWMSSKWEGRAPDDAVLLRVFFGGAFGGALLENDDERLVRIGREELEDLLGIEAAPLFSRVFRHDRANAVPHVGHLARVRTMKERLARFPGLHLAGAAYGGGIPECVRQGREVARTIQAAV